MVEVTLDIKSSGEGRRVSFAGGKLTIGRSGDLSSVIVEGDKALSRLHASIHREGGRVRIVDERSANGTYVNGEMVPPGGTVLADGDLISVGNHTIIAVNFNAAGEAPKAVARPAGATGLPVSTLLAPVIGLIIMVLGAVVVQRMTGDADGSYRHAGESSGRIDPSGTAGMSGPEEEPGARPAPSQSPSPLEDSILSSNFEVQPEKEIIVVPAAPRKLYRIMTDEEKSEFIKERAGRIAIMMGKRPYAFTPDALGYIKFWLEAFARRVGNNRTGLWGGDTRFILERGRIHAPIIIRAFKEHRVPPVIGLYIPFIETEYTNIRTDNFAGAAGLFQFLGPTAEHYGVPSSERTDVAKMAPAAARYFRDNIMNFGDDSMSVALAIAGYNRAPESVKRDLRNVLSAKNNEDKERNFWTLVANQGRLDHFFQNENKNYVPRFFAAAILGENPLAFGIEMRPLSTYTKIADRPPPAPSAEP